MKTKLKAFAICIAVLICEHFSPCADAQQTRKAGTPVNAEKAAAPLHSLVISNSAPPPNIANDAEIIVVSGHEAGEQSTTGARVRIVLDRPGKSVLMVLSSDVRIAWQVEASRTTRVLGILVGTKRDQSTVDTKVETMAYSAELAYVPGLESRELGRLKARLNHLLGSKKIDVLHARYVLPPLITITALDPPNPLLALAKSDILLPDVNFEFDLYTKDYAPSRWNLTGPAKGQLNGNLSTEGKFTVATDGVTVYSLKKNKFTITNKRFGKVDSIGLPWAFPEFSHVMDLAYDTRRDIVMVVSLGGEGFFYRFDTTRRKWMDYRSAENVDIYSLAYDTRLDRYVAWADNNELLLISSEGNITRRQRIADKLPDFSRLYRGHQLAKPRLGIAANGNSIALIHFDRDAVKNIWQYDPESQVGRLTYQVK